MIFAAQKLGAKMLRTKSAAESIIMAVSGPSYGLRRAFSTPAKRRTSVYMTISDKVGALDDILVQLRKLNINLSRIESRPSKTKGDYDFYVDFLTEDQPHLEKV
jgi:prephenate dehydratase